MPGSSRRIPSAAQLAHWERLLPVYSELPIALAPAAEELRRLGVPDEGLGTLPLRYERLLGDDDALLLERPEGVTGEELARLRRATPDFVTLCYELAAAARAARRATSRHDFHDGQVFLDSGRYRFLDWGDSCVSHPFHTLVVTLRVIAYKQGLPPGAPELVRLRDAYLEPFARAHARADLVAAADLAYRTGTIARALAWHRYLAAREPELRGEDAEAVPYGFRLFLAGGPIGTWNPDG